MSSPQALYGARQRNLLARELEYYPLACPDSPNLDSSGPILVFLGDLGLFPGRRSVFAGVPPYDRIDFRGFRADMGPLIRLCSTSRVAVSVVDTVSPESAAALGLPWGHPLYSLVIFSMPVQACPVLEPQEDRGRGSHGGWGDRLHVVWALKKAEFGVLRPWRSDHSVFLIKGTLARSHEETDYQGLHPNFDCRGGFQGRLVVGPCGRLHTMTSSTLRLRPVGGVARATLECHRLAPLVPRPVNPAGAGSMLETFVRGPDVGRMKLAQTRAHRSGYAKRRADGALGRLHQLCARAFALTSPGYRAADPPVPPFVAGQLVRLRWLARDEACRSLNGRTGRVVTPGCERTVVRLAGIPDRLVSAANQNLILAAGRPRARGGRLFPVLSPLAEHLKDVLEQRMQPTVIHTANGSRGNNFQRRMRLFMSTPEGASLFRALDEETRKVQRYLRNRVSSRAVVDPFRYPIVRIQRVTPMPHTEAFRSLRRQAARRPGF